LPVPSEGKIGRAVMTIAAVAAAVIALAVFFVIGFEMVQRAAPP
jgi:hypothetical protein